MSKPLCIDLFCGLGGWAEGFLSEGWDVIGFDIERHVYGDQKYPAQLVLQDVRTLHGAQLSRAAVIVASPPCQAYSYRAMPWKRAKTAPPPDNTLFWTCFKIQHEASEAAGREVPMLVENVRGAERWIGAAQWHFKSYYLWGDIPALMPRPNGRKVEIRSWSDFGKPGYKPEGFNTRAAQVLREGLKGDGGSWFTYPGDPVASRRKHWKEGGNISRRFNSKSDSRKAALAMIAKIPFPLAQHIAKVFKP